MKLKSHFLVALLLGIGTFFIYKTIYPQPRNWYDHNLHLTRSLLRARVDVPNLPQFYHDVIKISGKTFLPFPPGPSLLLIPFVVALRDISQQQVSIIIGALNSGLLFILLTKFTKKSLALILALFYAFGTSAFWSNIVGTTWFFAQNTAVFFLILSLTAHFSKKDFLSGILFSLAVLCRYPVFMGIVFFLLSLFKQPKRLALFLAGGGVVLPIQLYYSWARFGNILKTGYHEVYTQYLSTPFPQTILQILNPKRAVFGYLDPRNIPLHLYTFLIMPPNISIKPFAITPSPYGMGILFTSPLWLTILKGKWPKKTVHLLLGALAVAVVDFAHYMQGWVQFGYRFLLDFLPFLIIVLALKFRLNKLTFVLFLVSILVNFWGVKEAINLGW